MTARRRGPEGGRADRAAAPWLLEAFRRLFRHFGPLRWWPGETPFEVMVGAILTQNTAWTNVERAIGNLKEAGLLDPHRLLRVPRVRLARLLRPSGYYNIKAGRLRTFLRFYVREYGARPDRMRREPLDILRARLLSVPGIGRETADSIALYAAGRPIFVVDAYTRRILARHGLIRGSEDYDEIRGLFEGSLPRDARLYNEFHAQIVCAGKEFCRATPRCDGCPLEPLLPRGGPRPFPGARPQRARPPGGAVPGPSPFRNSASIR